MASPDVSVLLAQLGRLDNRPETIDAMQRGLDAAWAALEQAELYAAPLRAVPSWAPEGMA